MRPTIERTHPHPWLSRWPLALAVACGPAVACAQSTTSQATAPAVQMPTPIAWNGNATSLRGQPGSVHTFACPPLGTPGQVWGSDIYSDDSSICTAAVHSGRLDVRLGGVVQIQIVPGAASYTGTLRNGVTTLAYGTYPGSFTIVGGPAPGLTAQVVAPAPVGPTAPTVPPPPHTDSWTKNAVHLRGRVGQAFTFPCPPGGTPRTIWGTDVYTDDSPVCAAAVHAGRITQAAGGSVTVYIQPGRGAYAASARNGVSSNAFGAFPGSYAFVPVPPPPPGVPGAQTLAWGENATAFRGRNGAAIRVYCPSGGTVGGTIWGTGPYTDDSPVCGAAVHAGLITAAGGGVFTLHPLPGRGHYAASTRNGVTTTSYGAFAGSFALTH